MNTFLTIASIVLLICVFEINAQYGWNTNQGQGGQPGFPNNYPANSFPNFPQNFPQGGVNTRFAEETASDINGVRTHTRRVCDNNGCREISSGSSFTTYSVLLLISAYVASRFF